MTPRRVWSLLFVLLLAGPLAASAQVEITYLANEGFLLAAGERKVLIDALFGDGIRGYGVVPAAERARLERAEAPWDGVDWVLASHHHDDHFEPRAVLRHLEHAPGARFLSTRNAVDRLERLGTTYRALAGRVEGLWPAEGEHAERAHAGITVTALNLHHGRERRPRVQNLAFLIELGGLRVLHLGDTEVTVADLEPYRPLIEGVDVLLVPSWYFGYRRWRPVLEAIDARHRVVMHLAEPDAPKSFYGTPGSRERVLELIRETDPGAILMEKLERRTFDRETPSR